MTFDAPRSTPLHVIAIASMVALAAPIGIAVVARRARPVPPPAPDREVRPAPRPQIVFLGNHRLPSAALAGVVRSALRDHGPPYDRDVLDMAVLELSAYYWDRGYATVQIEAPELDLAAGAIAFTIHEGPVFTLSSVEVRGVPASEAAADIALLREQAGRTFSRSATADDLQVLEARYGDAGHAFASIEPLTKLDPVHRTIALAFEIAPGPKARIGRVNVDPHGRTTTDAMRRVLTVAPGEPYTQAALLDSKRRLQALGLGEVAVSIEHGSSPTQVDVSFELVVGDW